MPDYKEMYLKLFRVSESAIDILVTAQRECEEMYIDAKEPDFKLIDPSEKMTTRPED